MIDFPIGPACDLSNTSCERTKSGVTVFACTHPSTSPVSHVRDWPLWKKVDKFHVIPWDMRNDKPLGDRIRVSEIVTSKGKTVN